MKRIIIFLSFSIFFLIFYSSCKSNDSYNSGHVIKYVVSGTAKTVDVTISGQKESTEQFSNVIVPWHYSFTGYSGDFIYVSAQNNGEKGTVTVTILRDEKEIKTATSDGAYVIATASGSI